MPPNPIVEDVTPARGWSGAETVVRIQGEQFYPQVVVDAGRRGVVDVDRGFRAWLTSPFDEDAIYPLDGVTALDYRTLQAIIPSGLPEGNYDLTVLSPTGGEAGLRDAFEVTTSQIDRLSLDAVSVVATVNEVVFFRLNTLDPGGSPVVGDQDLAVRLTAAGTDLSALAWTPGSLAEQRVADDGVSLEGVIEGGRALVGFSVATPQDVTLTAQPLDPASTVGTDRATVRVEPGDITTLEIVLPPPAGQFVIEAGAPFTVSLTLRDTFGNPVNDVREVVLAYGCGGLLRRFTVAGTLDVELAVNAVTGTPACPEGRIVSVSPPGESEPFTVLPGPAASLRVQTGVGQVQAGQPFAVFVTSLDAFGNPATAASAPTLTASTGDLSVSTCVPAASSIWSCSAVTTIATPSLRLEATDSAGLTGLSATLVVTPSDVLGDLTLAGPSSLIAGIEADYLLTVRDEFGNAVPGAVVAGLLVEDELAEATCTIGTTLPDGRVEVRCTLFTARVDGALVASAGGLVSPALNVVVVNGDLAQVAVEPSLLQVPARTPFAVTLRGFDAFGNPYLVQADPNLTLSDTSGTLLPNAVALAADGTQTLDVAISTPGSTQIRAMQGPVELGVSPPVLVEAGPAASLVATLALPWAFVDEPLSLVITAVDADGFPTTWDGVGTVQSVAGLGPSVAFAMTDGVASLAWQADTPGPADQLTFSVGGLTGAVTVAAVPVRCPGGPEVFAELNPATGGRVCWDDATSTARATVVDSGTVGGVARWLIGGEADVAEATALPLDATLRALGRARLALLAVDAAGCGDDGALLGWVGAPDGAPVGPIPWLAPTPLAVVGGQAQVQLDQARACDGALANGSVFVRVDRGQLGGASPTGAGLALQVAGGAAQATLDLGEVTTGGPSRLVAWREGGVAFGEQAFEVDGDLAAPQVWSQAPAGPTSGQVAQVTLSLSEPLDEARLDEAQVALGGDGAPSVLALDASDGGTALTVTLAAPVDASSGVFTLQLDALFDRAGNALDGGWLGLASPWNSHFGAVDTPPAVACGAVDVAVFTPDGDDGVGEQADHASVTFAAGTLPARWRAEVRAAGELRPVRVEVWPAIAVEAAFAWDGRDATGRVVGPGAYELRLMAEDGLGGVGPSCERTVSIAAVEAP